MREGKRVTYVTPFVHASPYTLATGEAYRLNRMFNKEGVKVVIQHVITRVEPGKVTMIHGYAPDRPIEVEMDSLVLVTQRLSNDTLYHELKSDRAALKSNGVEALYRIGDCVMPRLALADSIFDAHRLAREIDSSDPAVAKPFIRENRIIGASDGDYDAIRGGRPESVYVPSSVAARAAAPTAP
jgi:dimethylamine/trimethylamine dehydrogenase